MLSVLNKISAGDVLCLCLCFMEEIYNAVYIHTNTSIYLFISHLNSFNDWLLCIFNLRGEKTPENEHN